MINFLIFFEFMYLHITENQVITLEKIKEQFENIASKIVFDNSRMIQQQHTDKLTEVLSPLKEKIEKFEKFNLLIE